MTKYFVVALLAAGLIASASAETKTAKAGEQQQEESTAKAAESSKPAKSGKPAARSAAKTRETPFGPVAETSTPAEALPEKDLSSDPSVSAEAKGDLVIFRRKTPFGNQVWRKKKSELTADEQSILARSGTSPEPAKSTAPAKQAPKPEASGKR